MWSSAREKIPPEPAITGYKTKPRSFSNISSADDKELCDNLNTFYARFDSKDNYSTLIDELETVCDNDNPIDISASIVQGTKF